MALSSPACWSRRVSLGMKRNKINMMFPMLLQWMRSKWLDFVDVKNASPKKIMRLREQVQMLFNPLILATLPEIVKLSFLCLLTSILQKSKHNNIWKWGHHVQSESWKTDIDTAMSNNEVRKNKILLHIPECSFSVLGLPSFSKCNF